MKKKLIALFCLLTLLISSVPAAALEGEALRSADLLATLNLVNGKENGENFVRLVDERQTYNTLKESDLKTSRNIAPPLSKDC